MSKQQTRQCQKCGSQIARLTATEIADKLDTLLERIADRPHDPIEGYDQRRAAEERAHRGMIVGARVQIGFLRDQLRGYCGLCAPSLQNARPIEAEAPQPTSGGWLAIGAYGARAIVWGTAQSYAQALGAGMRRAEEHDAHVRLELLEDPTGAIIARVQSGTRDCAELGLWRDSSGWHLPGQSGSASAEQARARAEQAADAAGDKPLAERMAAARAAYDQ